MEYSYWNEWRGDKSSYLDMNHNGFQAAEGLGTKNFETERTENGVRPTVNLINTQETQQKSSIEWTKKYNIGDLVHFQDSKRFY